VWTSENKIENSVFYGCKDEGIAFLGSKYSQCNENIVSNCIFYENCDGIELQYSSDNVILNCDIYENTHTGIDAIASSNNRNKIVNCEIYNNRVHGIYLSSSSDNEISDCSIYDNKDGDIVMNKYCENNKIITIDDDINNLETKYSLIFPIFQSFIDRISKFKQVKLTSFLDRL
jgi:parallel beta-helix repeat protein